MSTLHEYRAPVENKKTSRKISSTQKNHPLLEADLKMSQVVLVTGASRGKPYTGTE